MIIDDIEIIPTYDKNGEITKLSIHSKRHVDVKNNTPISENEKKLFEIWEEYRKYYMRRKQYARVGR